MPKVLALARRVEPHAGAELLVVRAHGHLARLAVLDAGDRELLAAGQAERSRRLARHELQRQDAHHQQVRAVDPLVRLGDHRAHAEQVRPLRRPVARRARAVLLAGDARSSARLRRGSARRRRRSSSPRRPGRCTVHVPSLPGTSWLRSRTFANVPRTITSWLPRRAPYELNARRSTPCSSRYCAGGRVGPDRAGGRDVVGRDRVAEHDEARARRAMSSTAAGLARHPLEVGRQADVRRVGLPGEELAGGSVERAPALVAGEDVAVGARGTSRRRPTARSSRRSRPRSARCRAGTPARRRPRRAARSAGRCPCGPRARTRRRAAARRGSSPSRRRGCAPRSCGCRRARRRRRGRPRSTASAIALRQRAGVADARRAAVADGVEAELVEVRVEAGARGSTRSRPSSPARATTSPTACASARARPPSSRAARRRSSPTGSTCSCTT